MNKRLIFILGTPRSGTSWAARTFELLPNVCALFEPDVPRRYDSPWRDQIQLYWDADLHVIDKLTATDQVRALAEPVIKHLDHVIEQEASSEHDTVVIKIPRLEKMPLLLDHYQPDHVFFMHRSPYAVLNSYERFGMLSQLKSVIQTEFEQVRKNAGTYGIDLDYGLAKTVAQKHALLTWTRHRLAPILLEPYSHTVVTYEDLCFESEERFRELFEIAGLGWSDDVGEQIRARSQAKETGKSFHSVQRVSEERAYGWRKELSPAITDSVRELFAALGCEDDTPPLTDEERAVAAKAHAARSKRLRRERLVKGLYHLKQRLVKR